MVFIWSRITHYQVLFILAVGLFTLSVGQFPDFITKEIGESVTFTCSANLTKNYTFRFFKSLHFGLDALPDARTKQFRNILVLSDLNLHDSAKYLCSTYDEDNNKISGQEIAILYVRRVKKYTFEITEPKVQSSNVDENKSFEFRCEYEQGSTELIWERREFCVNGTTCGDYRIPRDKITVLNDSIRSVEVYHIKKLSVKDAGTYRCQVMEKGTLRSTHARVLQVIPKQAPRFKKMKYIFTAKKDEDINILLEVDGSPSPNISCYRNDRLSIFCSGMEIEDAYKNPNPNDSISVCSKDNYEFTYYHIFIIRSASFPRNDGLYKCEATNIAGTDSVHFRVNVTVPPMISHENSPFFSEPVKEVGFVKCIIRMAKPKPYITWYQQPLPQAAANPKEDEWTKSSHKSALVFIHNARYESTLTIPYNQGPAFYRCVAKNELGNDSRVFKFSRYGEGQEPFVVTPSSDVKNEGQTFIAKCQVRKVIVGEIAFYRESTQTAIQNDNRTNLTFSQDKHFRNITMVMKNLTLNDTGTYRCSEKRVSVNDYAAVTLTVKALRPAMILDLQNQSVEQGKDSEVVLFCDVAGNPYPKVTWLRNGKIIPATLLLSSCDKLVTGYYKNKDHTRLMICKPGIDYTDFYTCSIKNKLGSDSRNVYLTVSAKPEIRDPPKTRKKILLSSGEAYKLFCMAVGNPPPLVQWILKNENRTMTNESRDVSTLQIEMDESYVGNYTCRARNDLGVDERDFVELELLPPEKKPEAISAGGGMTAGTIVGIVVGITVFLILVFLLVFLWYRRQQKKLNFYKHQYFLRTGDYAVDPSLTLNEQCMNLPYDSDWEFPFERLVVGDRLGAGAFGEVYKAEAMGILALNPRDKSSIATKRRSKIRRSLRASQRPKKKTVPPNLTNAIVAVKTVKGQATENEIRDLAAELKLMIHIGEHKNIVNLLGACTTGRKLYVILEFCPHGNLLMFLRSKRDMYDSTWVKEIYDPEKEFTLIDIVGAAFQIAKGMEFLAGRKLIHRDLAARNILVADEYVMKISDFGLARDIYTNDVYVKTSSGMLPVKWMAVESLFDRVYTSQSDVWAFGVLLWEMMTLGGTPYPNLPAEQLLDYLNQGKRMPQPAKCPLEVYTLMRDCWQDEPEARPTFSTIAEHLGRILEKHLEKANPYLHVSASPEEIEAAKERDELLKPKSDYYLQPLLLSNKLHGYNENAPLPTPPTDSYVEASAPLPDVDTKPQTSKIKGAGSYELLRDDTPQEPNVPLDNEDGIALEDMNNKQHEEESPKSKLESIV